MQAQGENDRKRCGPSDQPWFDFIYHKKIPEYRRRRVENAAYFFTVVTHQWMQIFFAR
jgi:hypothetical protein